MFATRYGIFNMKFVYRSLGKRLSIRYILSHRSSSHDKTRRQNQTESKNRNTYTYNNSKLWQQKIRKRFNTEEVCICVCVYVCKCVYKCVCGCVQALREHKYAKDEIYTCESDDRGTFPKKLAVSQPDFSYFLFLLLRFIFIYSVRKMSLWLMSRNSLRICGKRKGKKKYRDNIYIMCIHVHIYMYMYVHIDKSKGATELDDNRSLSI